MKIENINILNSQKTNFSINSADRKTLNNANIPSFKGKAGLLEYRNAKNNLNFILKDDFKSPLKAILKRQIGIKEFFKYHKNYDTLAQLKGYEYSNLHKWTSDELESIEGLQSNLKTLEHMNMKQIQLILDRIHEKSLTFSVVRGCYHNCAHCYLDAIAPIKRISFEDFKNTIDDLSEMSKRMHLKAHNTPNESKNTGLFYDSDGSQLFLKDKEGKVHEFPELNSMVYDLTGSRGLFDTAGWNPKNKEIQARMERLVNYYCNNKEELKKVYSFNLSINPFEGLYNKALQHKKQGNLEGYEKLKKLYIDMVLNMLTTFTPLIENNNVTILCRAYPNDLINKIYDGYKHFDVEKLRQEIIQKYLEKNSDKFKDNPNMKKNIENIFFINSFLIVKSRRNNIFKNFLSELEADSWERFSSAKNKKLSAINQKDTFVDLNGKLYFGNDFYLYKTDLQFNYANPVEKELHMSIIPETINFR